jgi:hypothetical protein
MLDVTFTPSTSEPSAHKAEVFSELAAGVFGVFKAGAVFSSFSGIDEFPNGVPGVDIGAWFTFPGSFLGALALARLRSVLVIVQAEFAFVTVTV